MKCETCGHNSRKGRKNGERKTLAMELCKIMDWPEEDIWTVQNTALGCKRLEDIINKLRCVNTTKDFIGNTII